MGSVKFKTGFNLTPVSLHLSDYSTILMTYTNCSATFVCWLHAILRQNMLAWSWSLLQIIWATFWRLANTFLILIMAFVHWLHAILRQNMLAWSWSLHQIIWATFWKLANTFLILIIGLSCYFSYIIYVWWVT